jgi:carbon storage regulator CsrA
MLVLSRECDTGIWIGPDIRVKVLAVGKQRVALGIDAPSHVPVWRDELVAEAGGADGAEPAAAARREFPILVIEDDPSHARLIKKVLDDAGYTQTTVVSTGRDGLEALGCLAQEASILPALVLLDLRLPDMTGLNVLERIRELPHLRALPVVVLSSERDDTQINASLESGANAFVNKSVDFRAFSQSVARIAAFWSTDCRLPRYGAPATA